ncbi:hypothetical protein P7C71_g5810, partial [Lecanoromycetidae sp. Uapishka_2]
MAVSHDERLHSRIQAIEKELEALSADVKHDENARKQLLGVVHKATAMVEAPPETIWRLLFFPHVNASIRTAIELGLFETLNNSEGPKTATELANITGGEKLLIVRILRPLAAMHFVIETGFETYVAGPVSKAFAIPGLLGGFKFMHDDAALSCTKIHEFLAQSEFKNPEGPNGVFQFAEHTELPLFPWLIQRPAKLTNFLNMLEGWREGRVFWYDFFPVEELLFKDFKKGEDSALLVDVAGGHGYDLQAFANRFPGRGPLVLQDLPPVIDDIKELHPDVARMKYDFTTPQPIKGAKAYYFRSICHDYSDDKCRELLSNTIAAMKPGYSRVLINDWVLPDTGSPLLPALLDIQMMAVLSGMERTESQWKELLDSVGLRISKIWNSGKEVEGLIEAVHIDIVAVHGLGGHFQDTWTDDSTQKLWLRDFVPSQLQESGLTARIMSYGYDSAIALSKSVTDIDDQAEMLLYNLKMERLSPSENKTPLMFIAHSLGNADNLFPGGIIVKKARLLIS